MTIDKTVDIPSNKGREIDEYLNGLNLNFRPYKKNTIITVVTTKVPYNVTKASYTLNYTSPPNYVILANIMDEPSRDV